MKTLYKGYALDIPSNLVALELIRAMIRRKSELGRKPVKDITRQEAHEYLELTKLSKKIFN